MKVGILGSGIVGQTLGLGFIKYGNEVKIGTEHPAKLNDWLTKAGSNGSVGSFKEAAKFGDLVVLSVKGNAAIKVLESAGSENLSSKTIIDTTNPIADVPPINGVLQFFTDLNHSLMEDLQINFPKANFVKAFSSAGNATMVDPKFGDQKPTMFIAGNNKDAKSTVIEILNTFGWDAEDMGMAEAARAIEPLCMLWCIPGFLHNQWTHAFHLLKK